MQLFFYNIFIRLYPFIARLISAANAKAGKWISGRKNIFKRIGEAFSDETRPVIWMHCASLGEFEQGRPLLEKIKETYPQYCILLTFFSPSGYEVQKSYDKADHIFYLPMDSAHNARKFLDYTRPALVIFIKYEFWYYYLKAIKDRSIPCLLVSAVFRPSQPFFQWYGNMHRTMLKSFTYMFVQNDKSIDLLRRIGFENACITGDTRFDRVLEIRNKFTPIPLVEQFCKDHTVVVAGSTWTEDDEELDHFVNIRSDMRFIIAPHDIDESRIKECMEFYKHAVLYSAYSQDQNIDTGINTLIIDNVGMLSRLYAYATITYVGGAFGGDGVHNVLEPAVYGKPVVFGPIYDKYAEAVALENEGAGFPVEDALELESVLTELLESKDNYDAACKQAEEFVQKNGGATGKVLAYIQEKRLFTN